MNDSTIFFQQLRDKKERLGVLITQATEYGWIDETRKEELISKINSDTLCIGVIGQMKCGKSTFLNSFVFGDTILPSATTPMTAALSVITYGEEKKLKAEFYTPDEWSEQKMQANRNLEDVKGDSAEESKIQAAKELVEKSAKLGDQLESLLGKTQEDTLDDLEQYVGADGKYVSITKSVTIYYPADYLKGVEIVDTPGFNDPIVSREERTKEFLKRADVVVMMLYAGRPFDATDRDILFKNVRQCGIGKVLIGINKYDIPYCNEQNPEDEEKIKTYVKNELCKASQSCGDTTLEELLKETEPIPLSAEMALLAQLPISKIEHDETLKFNWDRHCHDFGIGTQEEMYKWSKAQDLNEAIKKLVLTEKDKILFAKPLNAISAAGNEKLSQITNSLSQCEERLRLLEMPDDELDERQASLEKVTHRLNKKIDVLGDDIDGTLKNIIRLGINRLEDEVDNSCKKMRDLVDKEFGTLTSVKTVIPKLDNMYDQLQTRTLKYTIEDITHNAEAKIKSQIADFSFEVEELLHRYLPDYDAHILIKNAQKDIEFGIQDKGLFTVEKNGAEKKRDIVGTVATVGMGVLFGIPGVLVFTGLTRLFSHAEQKEKLLEGINTINNEFSADKYLNSAFVRKEEIFVQIRQKFITELVIPLQQQLDDVRSQTQVREEDKKVTERQKESLQEQKSQVEGQLKDIETIKNGL